MDQSFDISVVIATRNRFNSLQSTIRSIEGQTFSPKEIIIVDSSDDKDFGKENVKSTCQVIWLFSNPSVCAQRNLGIRSATSDWIFICDDDIELDKNYFQKLVDYARQRPEVGAIAGLLLQQEQGKWVKNYPVRSFRDLVWRFVFQHSIWGDIEVKSPWLFGLFHKRIIAFYNRRKNSTTLAGWPLITQWNEPVIRTNFFSLGANLIRKDWLLQSSFDEMLDSHGIGDNYGVAQNFPGEFPIIVITSTVAYHHRATENRINFGRARYLRIIALHYFLMKKEPTTTTKVLFVWSVMGHCLHSLIRDRQNLGYLFRALIDVTVKGNPYLNAKVTIK